MTRKKKLTAEEKMAREFSTAAFKCGVLIAMKELGHQKAIELSSDIRAIDQLVYMKAALGYSPNAMDDKLALNLDLPITKLEASFVKKMDAVIHKIGSKKVDKKIKNVMQL